MAWAEVPISEKGRAQLVVMLYVFSFLASTTSGVLIGLVVYSWIKHSFLLHDLIISIFDDIYLCLIILGCLLLITNLIGMKLNRNISQQPTNHSLSRCIQVWSLFLLLSFVAILLSILSMAGVQHALEVELGPRYKHGVQRYIQSTAWQTAVDRIQRYLQCCGANTYTDWYNSAWIPLSLVHGDPAEYAKLVQPSGRLLVPLTPSSCCRAPHADCGHLSWLNKTHAADVKAADPALLYNEGCVHIISRVVGFDLRFFRISLVIIAVLQLFTMVGTRYLYTSTLHSLLLGKPSVDSPGWLVGPFLDFGMTSNNNATTHDKVSGENSIGVSDASPKQKKRCRCIRMIRGSSDSDEYDLIDDSKPPKKGWKCLDRILGKSDSDENNETDASEPQKKGWKCLDKIRGKSNSDENNETDESESQKKGWKCLDKIRGKSDKENNTDETQSSGTEKKVLDSCCLAKLKPNCLKRKPETPNEDGGVQLLSTKRLTESELPEDKKLIYRVDTEIHAKNKIGKLSKRKSSRQLVDVEGEPISYNSPPFINHPNTYAFDVSTGQNTPFASEESIPKSKDSPRHVTFSDHPTPRIEETTGHGQCSILKHSSAESADGRDFHKTRNMFENANRKGKSPGGFLKNKQPKWAVDLIDFGNLETLLSKCDSDPAGPDEKQESQKQDKTKSATSVTSDRNHPRIVLRNYRLPTRP